MSILTGEIIENNEINITNKEKFGEVHTPFYFINDMLDKIPSQYFKDPTLKWLDIGSGRGNFSIILFKKLNNSLKDVIPISEIRKNHIISKMIFMIEINYENIRRLKYIFGENSNIIYANFLTYCFDFTPDIIIGNPPFNIDSLIKVPTNQLSDKKQDGKNAWVPFIAKSLNILPKNGLLNVIIPSIWMKPDKAEMYETLTSFQIEKLHTYNCSKTKKIFNGFAQTPTCSFLLKKTLNESKKIELYDDFIKKYVIFSLVDKYPIPLEYPSIVDKIIKISKKYPNLPIKKTNMPPKNVNLSLEKTDIFHYKNISTYIQKEPYLIIKYSDKPLVYNNQPKIVLAHKMYGLPYLDLKGEYGICNRDNYVISDKNNDELSIIYFYLNHPVMYFLYETTRYRMRYLEKYAFQFIFDFSRVFQNTNQCLYTFFRLNQYEIDFIKTFNK